ncbi:cation diffusion facilitator family transporter [Bdellovibrionota bacterium FG-2]
MRITRKTRHRAASLALAATIGLTLFKLAAGLLSGSVGVLSEAIHSFLDLISAALSYFTVRAAGQPADHDHPYGHGKIETLSSLFEALLLVVAAAWIIYEGIDHLLHPRPLQYEYLAIAVIFVSGVVSYLMYLHNKEAAVQTESSALHVNALHFLSDVVASGGILIGLILLKLTGWMVLDSIMAFVVAVYIFVISIEQIKKSLLELADSQLPDDEIAIIRGLLNRFQARTIEAHELRTRRSGSTRHIDFHLVVCGSLTVDESHTVCDDLEKAILETYPRSSVNIHVEPCIEARTECTSVCNVKWNRGVRQK